jgi:hypothetical protein
VQNDLSGVQAKGGHHHHHHHHGGGAQSSTASSSTNSSSTVSGSTVNPYAVTATQTPTNIFNFLA